MTYRATLEIVVTMNQLYLFNLRKQGQVRFKMNLFQKDISENTEKKKTIKQIQEQEQYQIYCNPYNIARKCDIRTRNSDSQLPNSPHSLVNFPNGQFNQIGNSPNQRQFNPYQQQANPFKQSSNGKQPLQTKINPGNTQKTESAIDYQGESYYSKVFDTKFAQQTHKIEESVFFKCNIPVDQMEKTSLMVKVQLLYSPDQQNMFKTLGCFKGKIRKLSPISSYLPVSFDQFQGFTISATYHTTVMEFKFQHVQQQSESLLNKTYEQFPSLQIYLKAATSNFRRAQTKNFYFYYREFLERQLFQVQQRHSNLIRILNLSSLLQYRFVKVNSNSEVMSILNGLPIFTTDKPIDKQVQFILIENLLQDFLQLKALIYEKWNVFVLFMTEYIDRVTDYYRKIYQKNLKERFKANVFSHKIENVHDWTFSKYQDSGKKYEQMAQNDKKKKKQQQLWSQLFPIQDQNCFEDQKTFIKMFEQVYPVRKERKLIPALRKFDLSIVSKNDDHQNLNQTLYHVGKTRQQNQIKYFKQPNNQKISFINIRKSSMVTLGQSDNVSLKDKNIQLGKSFHLQRSQTLKQKYQNNQFHNGFPKKQLGNQQSATAKVLKGQHIVILVHGYQASRQDFQVLKLCLQIRFKAKVFISSANQGRTDDSVQAMGKRLAIQLAKYFQNVQFTPNTKISFIGHSLGGVIIRSALGFLNNVSQYLYTYMSFSSPHLGYLYEPSRLVKAGLWFMNSWQGSKCLNQICMKDTEDLRTSYFFKLSENKALNGFKKIALISSSQDGYIPYESARIQKNSDILYNKLGDSISRNVIIEMVDNIIGQVQAQEISRINVIFHIEDKTMDSYIGRTAHIKYLSDLKFIKMFFIVFEKFFT